MILTSVGMTSLFVSAMDQKMTGNYRKQTQAFNIAEAGIQKTIATIRNDLIWRGEETTNPQTCSGSLSIGGTAGTYSVTISDATDDSNGLYNSLIPAGYVNLESSGQFIDSSHTVTVLLHLTPDGSSTANSPAAAVITTGPNTGSGGHVVNGFDNSGIFNASYILQNQPALPAVNQKALRAYADFSFSSLTNSEVDNELSVQSHFFKNHPLDTDPWIVHVSGNLDINGSRTLYGIIFVEGTTVTLGGQVRVKGVIYAPNATVSTTINGGGTPGDQPVMGQVICGTGGVHAAGNHADVQYVKDYVDAFNNFGGNIVDVTVVSWRHS
jgi:hypothetical protein